MFLSANLIPGHYTINSKLIAGGMSEAYRACDLRLDWKVAIKLLPGEGSRDPGRLKRFEQKKPTPAPTHPSILTVHNFSNFDNDCVSVAQVPSSPGHADQKFSEKLVR